MRCARFRAFSLLEVVIAIGVFAGAIAVILSLLPALGAQAASSRDALAAQRLPDALRIELQRLAANGGFDALASRVPGANESRENGLGFVASRDAARLHARDYLVPETPAVLPSAEQFFLVEVWRLSSGPLHFDAGGDVLPMSARVSWPYRAPGVSATEDGVHRSELSFNVSIRR
jgi:hypothetical protein